MPVFERLAKWDNLKGVLIICVVIGHFVQYGAAQEELTLFRNVFIYIYSFHMPMFIFVMGLFYKRTEETQLKTDRIRYYLILYVGLKTLIFLLRQWLTGEGSFTLLSEDGTPWYMFAAAVYMGLAYVIRNQKPAFVVTVSVLLGIFVGYDASIGDFLVLSRIFVYAPFFFLGYYAEPKTLARQLDGRKMNYVIALMVMIGLAVYCSRNLETAYAYRPLFTGRHAYQVCKEIENCSGWNRILSYGIALVVGMSLAVWMPNRKIPLLTNCGRHSLGVYFWHRLVLYILNFYMVETTLQNFDLLWYQIIWMAIAVILALVLSLPVFEVPLQWLAKLCGDKAKADVR